MSLFSKLFRRSPKRSELEQFISLFGPDAAVKTFHSVRNEELRLASSVAVAVLFIAGRFYSSLTDVARKLPGAPNGRLPYDALVFETAAYSHYFLLRQYLRPEEDPDADDADESEDDYYFRSLRDAIHVTSGLLKRHTRFALPDEFFVNTVGAYSSARAGRTMRDEATDFERRLVTSIVTGAPAARRDAGLGDLSLEIAVKSAIPIFHQTWLPALDETVRGLHRYDLENPA